MDWDDLRYVLTVARAGTFAAAARRLRVDQTTVARRLGVAEAALGARLFERVDGTLRATAAGEAVLARAALVESEVAALEHGVGESDARPVGLVRVTAVPLLVNRLLTPGLPRLLRCYPGLDLELVADARNLNLTRRDADIAVRFARPAGGGDVLTTRLASVPYAVYGARGRAADRLAWIGYEDGMAHLPQARWIAAAVRRGEPARLHVNDAEAIVHAIRAGLGKSLLPCFVGDRAPGMTRLDETRELPVRELWLLTHRQLRRHARIEAVVAWLRASVASALDEAGQG